MIDILITTYNRIEFLKQTLASLFRSSGALPHRISVIDDCSTDGTREYLYEMRHLFHSLVLSNERHGIVPNFNRMWDLLMGDGDCPYFCYMQDDLVSEVQNWLDILMEAFLFFQGQYSVGLASGYDAREHLPMFMPEFPDYPDLRVQVKRSSSMQNFLGEKAFWQSIGKPPELDYEGKVRGFPNDAKGSDIDIWFTGCYSLNRFNNKAASPNCLCLQGKTVLVVPMLKHLGAEKKDSTWRQNREKGF